MKNSLLSLGTVLTKNQQRNVTGGLDIITAVICDDRHCWEGEVDTERQIQRKDGTWVP